MAALLAALLVAAVIAFLLWALSGPFRGRGAPRGAEDSAQADELRSLATAKEAKYAEIRDNETDYRTGKLSERDFRELDRQLRAEAVEILRAIDAHALAGGTASLQGIDRTAGTSASSG
jgi:hypothetical protein